MKLFLCIKKDFKEFWQKKIFFNHYWKSKLLKKNRMSVNNCVILHFEILLLLL